jgi:undecaprenyl-diphosphatase
LVLAVEGISWLQAAVIGLVEGLTEFLPVSSTAHMAVVPQLLKWPDPGAAFSAVVQLGPTLAIILYFRHELANYLRGMVKYPNPLRVPAEETNARLGWFTLLASLPILGVGFLLKDYIEGPFRSLYVIAGAFVAYGLVLWLAEVVGKRLRTLEQMTFRESQVIGWAQCLALIPGVSRSGATMSAALFQGLDRESALRFSFLLSIPGITAAGLFELYKDVLKAGSPIAVGPLLLGTFIAGISAYVVIHWFLEYVRKHSTLVFIVYRIVVGILLFILLGVGALKDSHSAAPQSESQRVHSSTKVAHRWKPSPRTF